MALAMNKRTGKTVSVPEHYLGHPVLGQDLVSATAEKSSSAAPKKEKKSFFDLPETEEQLAPETDNETNEE